MWSQRVWNLPNIISMFRIVLVPLVACGLYWIAEGPHAAHPETCNVSVALLFGIAACSDVLDGYIARRYAITTVFGKLVDPLADKLMTFAALIMLIPMGRMAAWLVLVVVVRELSVTTLRAIAAADGQVISAGRLGKMKNAFSNFGISFLILYDPHFGVDWYATGWTLFLISVLLAVASGIEYHLRFFAQMRRRLHAQP
jgi:CDP-diacylglycerol---glycerol-3-phosphate 3-phosphatidyltransferase